MAGTFFHVDSIPPGTFLFQLPDILSRKGQQGIFPFNPGGDLGRVPPGQLSRRQV